MMPGCRARPRRTRDGTRTGPAQRGRCGRWRRSWPIPGTPAGRQVWNRQRTDFDLADPSNTSLGHRQVQRWNLPEGWMISKHLAHATLVSEADFIAAQDMAVPRARPGPLSAGTCLPGCWPGGGAGAGWNQPGPTASPPTAAATVTPAPPAPAAGPPTLTSARIKSSRTWPLSASSSPHLLAIRTAGIAVPPR